MTLKERPCTISTPAPASPAPQIGLTCVNACNSVLKANPLFVAFRWFAVQIHCMQQAIIDPEQVRRFAEELQRFNRDVQHRLSSLQARFGALGDSWQDQEHTKFSDEFKQTVKALKKFVEMSDQHVPYLMRKVQRIEEYLKQR